VLWHAKHEGYVRHKFSVYIDYEYAYKLCMKCCEVTKYFCVRKFQICVLLLN